MTDSGTQRRAAILAEYSDEEANSAELEAQEATNPTMLAAAFDEMAVTDAEILDRLARTLWFQIGALLLGFVLMTWLPRRVAVTGAGAAAAH